VLQINKLYLQVFEISKVHTLHLSLLKELVLKLLFQSYCHNLIFDHFILIIIIILFTEKDKKNDDDDKK
jgi:hypothetical protein